MIETNTIQKIIDRCIGDDLPFCVATCPLHVDMKGAIALIRDGDFQAALNLIRETLPFPGVLGRICTHPCEDKCQRSGVDTPISIMALHRAAADYGNDAKWELSIDQEKAQRVAIIGSGPAGLMSAYELRRLGYQVTIFEALPVLGGMLAIGIPRYRLPRDILQQELGIIEKLGIQVKLNTRIGEEIKFNDLKMHYDAVFIASGATMSRKLSIEGTHLKGVHWGMDFLREVSLGKEGNIGDKVVVLGAGNVAADVALTALRLGAKQVQMAFRKCLAEMRAFKWEVQQLIDEGVILHSLCQPKHILGSNGRVTGIEMVRDESGILRLDSDSVILAIGQAPDTSFITEDSTIKRTRDGYIIANETTLATNVPSVFAGGDGHYGPKSVIEALASGEKAAISIDRYLRGEDLNVDRKGEGTQQSRLKVNSEGKTRKERVSVGALPVEARKGNFREVELGLTRDQARQEAERCLSCECRLCVRDCQFLNLYCRTPKEMAQKFKDGYFREKPVLPYSCNLCELCGKLCPEQLCSGDMCMEIRELMVKEKSGPLPQHQFVRRDQEYVRSDAVALTKPGEPKQCEWAFFPGCSLSASSPELVIIIHKYLQQKLPGTGVILRCCGAPTHCLGDDAKFESFAHDLVAEVKKLGASGLIIACPDCYRTIKRSTPDLKIRSLYDVIVEQGLPSGSHATSPKTFSLHDSCTARDETTFTDNVRTLIKDMGYQLKEMEYSREKTRCCGAGGMIPYVNPELFMKLAKQRASEAECDVITYCAACRDTFASTGKPAIHVLETIFNPGWEKNLHKPPQTGKARRDKQAELKRLLSMTPPEK